MLSSMGVKDTSTKKPTRHRAGSLRIRVPTNEIVKARQLSHTHPNINTHPFNKPDNATPSPKNPESTVMGSTISNLEDLQDFPDTFTRLPTDHVPQPSKFTAQIGSSPRRLDWRFAKQDDFDDTGTFRVDAGLPRKDSGVIVSPHFESSTEQPELKASDHEQQKPQKKSSQIKRYRDKLGDAFHEAVEMYEAGPPGEGHELWRLLRKDEHAKTKDTRTETPRSDGVKRRVVEYVQRQKKHVHNAKTAGPQRSQSHTSPSQPPRLPKPNVHSNLGKITSRDAELSFNSPSMSSEKSSRTAQIINTNKPLPQLPKPEPTRPSKPARPRPLESTHGIVSNPATGLVNNDFQRNPKGQVKPEKSSRWWKAMQKDEKPQTHEEQKRQISRPIYHEPQEVSCEPVTHVTKDSRGASASARPVDLKVNKPLPDIPRPPTRDGKGKQKTQSQANSPLSRLRDKVVYTVGSEGKSSPYSFFSGRSRTDSDASMVCIGKSDAAHMGSPLFVRDPGPSRQGPEPGTGRTGVVWQLQKQLGAGDGIGDWEDARYSCGYNDLLEEYYEV